MNEQNNNAEVWNGYSVGFENLHIPVGWRPVFVDELRNSNKNGKRNDFLILRTEEDKYQRHPLFAFINDKQLGPQELVSKIIRSCVSEQEIREAGGNLFQLFEKAKGKLLAAYIEIGTKKLTGETFNKITAVMNLDEYLKAVAGNKSGGGLSQEEIDAFEEMATMHDQNSQKSTVNGTSR